MHTHTETRTHIYKHLSSNIHCDIRFSVALIRVKKENFMSWRSENKKRDWWKKKELGIWYKERRYRRKRSLGFDLKKEQIGGKEGVTDLIKRKDRLMGKKELGIRYEKLVRFRLVLQQINYCRLFNAKSSLYIYIRYMICEYILSITFLNEPELILFAHS